MHASWDIGAGSCWGRDERDTGSGTYILGYRLGLRVCGNYVLVVVGGGMNKVTFIEFVGLSFIAGMAGFVGGMILALVVLSL